MIQMYTDVQSKSNGFICTPSEGTHLSLILLNTSFILSYCMHYFILYIVTLYRFPKLGVGIKQRFFSPLLYETTWVRHPSCT